VGIGKILADVARRQHVGQVRASVPWRFTSAGGPPAQEWRAFVAIMNVGGGPATNIRATYYDAAGNSYVHNVATAANPLGKFFKRNTTAPDAGAPANFGITPVFGGAVDHQRPANRGRCPPGPQCRSGR
jgi:hypothetical protein